MIAWVIFKDASGKAIRVQSEGEELCKIVSNQLTFTWLDLQPKGKQ